VANNTATPVKKQASLPPAVIVIGAVMVVGLAGFFYLQSAAKRPAAAPAPLTGPAKDYVKFLKFVSADGKTQESPQMQAHESYMKLSVVEITGNIQNTGDRVLEAVEINCVFTDPYGNVLLRERVPIVSKKMGKLAPGETKAFRLAFDNVPESWNQAMPQMVIARIEFA
jgi:hypothetical protein